MTIRLSIRLLLPLLAVLGLAIAPVAAAGLRASMTVPSHVSHDAGLTMDHAAMPGSDQAGMDDMSCCPNERAEKSDCTKDCPLMALCLAGVASLVPVAVSVPAPLAARAAPAWPVRASFASVLGPPLPEPPRA